MNADQNNKEFSLIENRFKDMPLQEPSEAVLMRVRERAQQELRRPLWSRFFSIKVLPQRPALALAAMVVLVLGLSITLRVWQPGVDQGLKVKDIASSSSTKGATSTNGGELVASFAGERDSSQQIDLNIPENEVFKTYVTGLSLFNKGRFKEANELFAKVIELDPKFGKRLQLYGYWVEALEKMGNKTEAEVKRAELKKIQEELAK